MTTAREAWAIAAAVYASDPFTADVTVVGLWEDETDYMVGIRYPLGLVPLGPGALMIRKADGEPWSLCSAEVGQRVSGMTEVAE